MSGPAVPTTPSKAPAPTSTSYSGRLTFPRILTWADPVKSGTVLGEILAVLLVVSRAELLRFVLRLSYSAIFVSVALEFVSRRLYGDSKGVVSSYKPSRLLNIDQRVVERFTASASRTVAGALNDLNTLLDAEDLTLSLGAFGALFSAYILTAVVSFRTLALVATAVAFAVPPLYLQFQPEIDQLIGLVHKEAAKHVEAAHSQIREAATPHINKVYSQFGDLASRVGYTRGGVPEAPAPAPEPVVDPSARAAEPAQPVKTPKVKIGELAEEAVADGAVPVTAPLTASAQPEVRYDSIPTLTGNVPLPHSVAEKDLLSEDKIKAIVAEASEKL